MGCTRLHFCSGSSVVHAAPANCTFLSHSNTHTQHTNTHSPVHMRYIYCITYMHDTFFGPCSAKMSSCIDMSTAGRIFQSPRDPCVIYINIGFNPKGSPNLPSIRTRPWDVGVAVQHAGGQFEGAVRRFGHGPVPLLYGRGLLYHRDAAACDLHVNFHPTYPTTS